MKKKANNKKVIIAMLIVLLLALAIGYAAFSDILTISGTANAKGTFDLEFQNAEVVKNVGADIEKTTAVILDDKNTLTVNVADLSFPGSGVEFSVDIVNVGTIPAEVQAVTPTNINGSDKIKVIGLDVIKTDHPKIEVGDRCNIHFTVEWPADAGEIAENESSISFGLQIEYVQSTGEAFDGESSHEDLKKGEKLTPKYTVPTNLTATYGDTLSNITLPEQFSFQDKLETSVGNPGINKFKVMYTPTDTEKYRIVTDIEVNIEVEGKKGILSDTINKNYYGKNVNYKAMVKNNTTNETEEVSNWKLLYKDESKLYIILDGFLPKNLVPTASGLRTTKNNVVNSTSREELLNGLRTTAYWSEFANGYVGATAQGAPDFDILIKSYNEKYNTSINTDPSKITEAKLNCKDSLYLPSIPNDVQLYWVAAEHSRDINRIWYVFYTGNMNGAEYNYNFGGVRPVVSIPANISGTIGETIEIK